RLSVRPSRRLPASVGAQSIPYPFIRRGSHRERPHAADEPLVGAGFPLAELEEPIQRDLRVGEVAVEDASGLVLSLHPRRVGVWCGGTWWRQGAAECKGAVHRRSLCGHPSEATSRWPPDAPADRLVINLRIDLRRRRSPAMARLPPAAMPRLARHQPRLNLAC